VAQLNVLWLLLFNFLSFSFSPTVASHGVVSPSEFRIRQASQPIPAGNTVQINTTSTVAAKTIQNATPLVAAQPVQNATPAVTTFRVNFKHYSKKSSIEVASEMFLNRNYFESLEQVEKENPCQIVLFN